MSLLDSINSPADFKAFSIAELEELARELRARVLDVVNHNGGNLQPPVWADAAYYRSTSGATSDLGHGTSAPAQMLTGRARVDTIRRR